MYAIRSYYVRRTAKELAKTELLKLGIRAGSEIYEFFTEFNITLFISQTSYEQLCDVCEPTPQIWDGTVFVREVWGVITSYSIHYTKLYDGEGAESGAGPLDHRARYVGARRISNQYNRLIVGA